MQLSQHNFVILTDALPLGQTAGASSAIRLDYDVNAPQVPQFNPLGVIRIACSAQTLRARRYNGLTGCSGRLVNETVFAARGYQETRVEK
jgi:hypothetical protein